MKKIIPLMLLALALLACDVGSLLGQGGATPTTVVRVITATPAPAQPTQPPAQPSAQPPAQPTQPPAQPSAQPPAATKPPVAVATQAPVVVATQLPAPVSDLPLYDGFDNAAFENSINPSLWKTPGDVGRCPGGQVSVFEYKQKSGALNIDSLCAAFPLVIETREGGRKTLKAYEVTLKLAPNASAKASAQVFIQIAGDERGNNWKTSCTIDAGIGGAPKLGCGAPGYGTPGTDLKFDTWYRLRIEMDDTLTISYFLDNTLLGKYKPATAALIGNFTPGFGMQNVGGSGAFGTVLIDAMRIQ
ncbi:MAG: hypothetical protein HZC40_12560 [Chloroflexi bacterium]|nr:hypothetical protein [Chloroflexota bacterium]